mmetsp:Transcript_31742/g.47410  ORF Transcript_31742/g.47410 Transcript_31742/m.47410 type:complete len:186 (-) Transcript_31742:129-686(-)
MIMKNFTTAFTVLLAIVGLITLGAVDASSVNNKSLLRGSSAAIEEETSVYSADYIDGGEDYDFVEDDHHNDNGKDYNDEEEESSLYQNNLSQRNRWTNPAADRKNGVGNKQADRTNGRGIGICWACNGVPITQWCRCRDGPRKNWRNGGNMADRWVHRVRKDRPRPRGNVNDGVGNEQVDGMALE